MRINIFEGQVDGSKATAISTTLVLYTTERKGKLQICVPQALPDLSEVHKGMCKFIYPKNCYTCIAMV